MRQRGRCTFPCYSLLNESVVIHGGEFDLRKRAVIRKRDWRYITVGAQAYEGLQTIQEEVAAMNRPWSSDVSCFISPNLAVAVKKMALYPLSVGGGTMQYLAGQRDCGVGARYWLCFNHAQASTHQQLYEIENLKEIDRA
jgi:hypothetical protein